MVSFHGIFSLCLCLRAQSLNNAVYSMSLAYCRHSYEYVYTVCILYVYVYNKYNNYIITQTTNAYYFGKVRAFQPLYMYKVKQPMCTGTFHLVSKPRTSPMDEPIPTGQHLIFNRFLHSYMSTFDIQPIQVNI